MEHSYGKPPSIGMKQRLETRPWDVIDHLQNEEDLIAYLNAVLEDGDPALLAAALDDIARAASLHSQFVIPNS